MIIRSLPLWLGFLFFVGANQSILAINDLSKNTTEETLPSVCTDPFDSRSSLRVIGKRVECIRSDSVSLPKITAEKFEKDLKTYIPKLSWITCAFLEMDATTFVGSWDVFVDLFCYRPWDYYCVSKSEFDSWKNSEKQQKVISECMDYVGFLTHLYVNLKDGKIFYEATLQQKTLSKLRCVPIIQYLKSIKNTKCDDFFAFCFDRAFSLLVYFIQKAQTSFDNSQEFYKASREAKEIHFYLEKKFSLLK